MATLTGKTIAATYTSLLKLEGNTGSTVAGASGDAVQVKTGDNDATPLYLNTDMVGIGAAAPGDYNASMNNLVVYETGGNAGISIITDNNLSGYLAFGDGTGSNTYRGIIYYDHSTDAMSFGTEWAGTGATVDMSISSAGNVTINDNTASSATEGGSLRLQSNDGAVMASGHRLGVLEFAGAEDTSNTITVGARIEAITDATWSASENGADMVFYTTDGNASQSEVMRLTADNKVGIGVSDPDTLVELYKVGTQLKLSGGAADYATFAVAADGALTITTVDTDAAAADIILAPDGNVGIGTGTPTTQASVNTFLEIDGGANRSGLALNGLGSSSRWEIVADEGDDLFFARAGDIKSIMTAQGTVGFGTTTPTDAKLQIDSVASGDYGIKVTQAQNMNGIYIDNNGTASAMYIENTGSTGGGLEVYTNTGATQTTPLVKFINDNVLFDQPVLKIQQDSAYHAIDVRSKAPSSATAGAKLRLHTDDTGAIDAGHRLGVIEFAAAEDGSNTITNGARIEAINTHTAAWDASNNDADMVFYTTSGNASESEAMRITASGGVHEKDGVLKENLITNSGFDVWSNSTLVNVADVVNDDAADDGTGDWTDSGGSAALAFDTDHYEFTTSATWQNFRQSSKTLVAGKLYRISAQMKNGSGTATGIYFEVDVSGGSDDLIYGQAGAFGSNDKNLFTTTGSFVTNGVVFEAVNSSSSVRVTIAVENSLSGNNFEIKDILLEEVTPGCVADDDKACDGWGKDGSGIDVFRVHNDGGTLTKDGSFYALKAVTGAVNRTLYANHAPDGKAEYTQRFAGRTVTMGAWVKATDASHCRLRLYDGSTETDSSFHTGGGAWEWLEVTATMSASATYSRATIFFAGTGKTAYISQPMLVFGSSIGEGNYTRPQGEIVWCETPIQSTYFASANDMPDKGWTSLPIEADTNGKIPKGALAGNYLLDAKDVTSTSGGADCYIYFYGSPNYGTVEAGKNLRYNADNKAEHETGWLQFSTSAADLRYTHYESATDALSINMAWKAIQLR